MASFFSQRGKNSMQISEPFDVSGANGCAGFMRLFVARFVSYSIMGIGAYTWPWPKEKYFETRMSHGPHFGRRNADRIRFIRGLWGINNFSCKQTFLSMANNELLRHLVTSILRGRRKFCNSGIFAMRKMTRTFLIFN